MTRQCPDILVLMTDQQRYDSLGCYGVPFAHTPNLDRLAAQGVVFDHCYVNNPICTPSRASMFTGKHLPEHGVYRLYDNLPKEEVLFTERLQGLGYTTALFGKLHVSSIDTELNERHPHDGFDVYEPCLEATLGMDAPYQAYSRWLEARDPEFHKRLRREGRALRHTPQELHLSHWAAERTIDFLKGQVALAERAPFFCMMSIFEPHNPYEHYPEAMGDLVDADAIPDPVSRGDRHDEPAGIERERRHSYLGTGDIDDLSPDDLRKMRHGYHASVAYADLEFGRVLDTLDDLALTKNTLVIFTSDHGDMLGDHELLVKGAFFYDPNVRVPLLMRWPGRFGGGTRVSGRVQLHDLAATILAAAGVSTEDYAKWMPDARDLLPLATQQETKVHDTAICCYRNSGIAQGRVYWDPPINATMVCDERYKLNLWHGTDNQPGELFDMQADPLEQENRWHDPALQEVRVRLTDYLTAWLKERDRTDKEEDDER
jgi:arylsulfatase